MRLSLIFAMGKNREIGFKGGLPWRLPGDLRHFKKTTMGKPIIMGRRTFDTLDRLLPGRVHIILTRQKDFPCPEGHFLATDFKAACAIAADLIADEEGECMVVGGAEIYALALPVADRLYMSLVQADVEADTFFPDFNRADWIEKEALHHSKDEAHSHAWSQYILERNA